jgi:hypothetical protein
MNDCICLDWQFAKMLALASIYLPDVKQKTKPYSHKESRKRCI